MRTNRKDVGRTYNSVTGCTPGKGTSGCSEAGFIQRYVVVYDAVEMYQTGMHFTHSIQTPCVSSRKQSTHGSANGFKLVVDKSNLEC